MEPEKLAARGDTRDGLMHRQRKHVVSHTHTQRRRHTVLLTTTAFVPRFITYIDWSERRACAYRLCSLMEARLSFDNA